MSVLNSALSQSTNSSWFSRTSYDSRSNSGRSQNYWKLFRKEVLAPHHIRVLSNLAGEKLPEPILTWVEANRGNTERFAKQKKQFRKQVSHGRGFGSSALFPQEVLPSNDARPFLSRCMVPTLSADALPERMIKKAGNAIQKSSLSIPRPSLGCGFSTSAFATEEINCMPDFMLATGTTIDFSTGSISTGTALYCPFFSYERVFSQQDYGIEIAANQCAIDGAWSVRSLQMLYAKANNDQGESEDTFANPISFTCAIDNNVAMINYHWVDHAQTYCMAPVIKFELSRDDHFDQFLIWTEAVGQWALSHLLPEVKKAVSRMNDYVSALPALKNSLQRLDNRLAKDQDSLVSALKLSYDNIPWRYDHEEISPVSSSTASWGSPMVNEAVFSKFEQQPIPRSIFSQGPRSVCSDANITKGVRFAVLRSEKPSYAAPKLSSLTTLPALPAIPKRVLQTNIDENSDLVIGKRMSHAMEEINDLQAQLLHLKQELSGSTICIQNELSGLRKEMSCVIRKEQTTFSRARSPLRTNAPSLIQTEQRLSIQKGVSVVTTPTDPRPALWPSPKSNVRKPSGLAQMLTVDTNVEAVSVCSTMPDSAKDYCSADDGRSPITIYSPTIINVNNGAYENYMSADLIRVSSHQPNVWTQVAATHLLSTLMPSTLLRVLFLGALLDYCMMSMRGSHPPTMSQYLSRLMEMGIH